MLWQRFRKDFRRFFRLDFLNLSKTQFNSPRLLSGQRSICLYGTACPSERTGKGNQSSFGKPLGFK